MAATQSAITANLNPNEWVKMTSAEKNVLSFEKWIAKYERWESLCTGGLNYTPTERWNLLLSIGGSDLEDVILHQVDIQVKDIPAVDPVQGQEGQEEIRDAQGNITQQFRAPVRAVIGKNAIVPTNWEEVIDAIKAAIGKYSNEVMARYKLMFQMPASDYSDWRKWGQELLEQAKRCKWEEYLAEQAAVDALLFQCPNQQWKDKIMEGTLNFQEAINWGMTKLTAKQEGKKIGGKPDTDSPILPVDKVTTDTKTVDCRRCFEKTQRENARHTATSARNAIGPTTSPTQKSARTSLQPEPNGPAVDAARPEDNEAGEAEVKAEAEDTADHPT